MTLGDGVAVLKKGRLQQVASPRELYEQPVNLFVAGFIGSPSMNFLPAREAEGRLETPIGTLEVPEGVLAAARGKDLVLLGVRPEYFEDMEFVDEALVPHGSRLTATPSHTEWLGNEQYGYIGYAKHPQVRAEERRAGKEASGRGRRT